MTRPLVKLDHNVIRHAERRRPPSLDRLFTWASRAANRSLIWFAAAGVLGALGGSRGRRAAGHGCVAIAVTSAVANGPAKLLVRRPRPSWRTPLVSVPRTTSFPSGHSASAFAFAVAVSGEMPAAAVVLVPLAVTVSYSRVYVGVHYPSDVLFGAALGAAIGALTDRALRAESLRSRVPTPYDPSAGDRG
jgi:undecaprenyl-diphosphatase